MVSFPTTVIDEKLIRELNQEDPNKSIVTKTIYIDDTVGLTSETIRRIPAHVNIRVSTGYTASKLNKEFDCTGNYLRYKENSVIYSRNELYAIVREMEKIEERMAINWSQMQKALYIYEKLMKTIAYDVVGLSRDSTDIRSLRGIVTKKTVCAGYALILKEMLNRQHIECAYVEGKSHAWNLMRIDGKIYPLDLTFDARRHYAGQIATTTRLENFANPQTFIPKHKPAPYEATQDYQRVLSGISREELDKILSNMPTITNLDNRTRILTKKDGSTIIVAQIAEKSYNGKTFVRYTFLSDSYKRAGIAISTTNMLELFHKRDKAINDQNSEKREDADKAISALTEELFSKENLVKTFSIPNNAYLGEISKNNTTGNYEVTRSPEAEASPLSKKIESRTLVRSDNSIIIINKPTKKDDYFVHEIVEFVDRKSTNCKVSFYEIESKTDFFTIQEEHRKHLVDTFLKHERLEIAANMSHGYIGGYEPPKPTIIQGFPNIPLNINQSADGISTTPTPIAVVR